MRGTTTSASVFTVRQHLIREALVWLIDNNPMYKNVTISEHELATLREQCDNVPTLIVEEEKGKSFNNVNNNDSDDDADCDCEEESFELQTGGGSRIESDEILDPIRLNDGLQEDAYIDSPSSVINEYTMNTLMQSCFPTLFPDGTGGFNATTLEKRHHTYDLADYCAHIMRWHDRRFVIHPNFKSFCLNLIQRRPIGGLTRRLATQRGDCVCDADDEHDECSSSAHISQPLDGRTIDAALDAAQEPNSNRDQTVPRVVDLAIGVLVTLTHNLAQNAGLCNGTKAIVYDFMYAPSSTLPVMLAQILDKYIGPSCLPGKENIVPIPPHVLSWLSSTKSHRTARTGLPLRLGYAMTIHKVQGLTCCNLVFNPVAIPTSTFAYVGLSRVRHRDHVVLIRPLQSLKSVLQRKTRKIRHEE